jgi:NADH-ubiquinone oxidoreductase chain 6
MNKEQQQHLFKTNWIKIIVLIVLHIIGLSLLGFLAFYLISLILAFIGTKGGILISELWNNLNLNIIPCILLFFSFLVIHVSSPIFALIYLILIFFVVSIFLISIHIEFLAMIYIIIYIGAIAILFLFVIMMFNLRDLRQIKTKQNDKKTFFISFVLYCLIFYKFYDLLTNTCLNYLEYHNYLENISMFQMHNFITNQPYTCDFFTQDFLAEGYSNANVWQSVEIDRNKIGGYEILKQHDLNW